MPNLKEGNKTQAPERVYGSGRYYTVTRGGKLTRAERARIRAERTVLRRELIE